RDAAKLWASLTEERGVAGRDAIWRHPDLLPAAEDLDDPTGFSARRSAAEAQDTEVDAALEKLLAGGFDEPSDETPSKGGGEPKKGPEDGSKDDGGLGSA
ncbi:zinc-dependent metalloprotease, partial [Sinomonas sp. G460-2]|uniref:zinc-dependent metalloprotease n=1 Tax=Sinomonas sp. G460-2 TaxID=3393464 RepID=UPI0039F053CA